MTKIARAFFNVLVASSFLALGTAAPARAWGPKGHEVVAMLAEDRLSAKAASKISKLLGRGVHLADIAGCAAEISNSSGPVRCASFTVAADSGTAAWHVLAIPLASKPTVSSLDGFCGKACLLSAIEAQRRVLGNARAARPDRQKALMYLVHLAGDLHQPLHCALDDASEDSQERFGNAQTILWQGRPHPLHQFWDDMLLTEDESLKVNARGRLLAPRRFPPRSRLGEFRRRARHHLPPAGTLRGDARRAGTAADAGHRR